MNNSTTTPVAFQITGIETLQYALLQDSYDQEQLGYVAYFGFGIDVEAKSLRSVFKYEFQSREKTVLIIEVAVDFAIAPDSFDSQISAGGRYAIPRDFALHLAMIAVGTARGILHEKTKDSAFGKLPIPTVDVAGSVEEDVLFDAVV